MTVKIRPALLADLSAIARIEAGTFANPWQPDTFRSLLTRERVKVLVAEDGEEISGYAVLWWVLEQGELANLAVKEDAQGKGIGSTLLAHITSAAEAAGVESLFLEVRRSNRRAQGLYFRRGFVQVSIRRDYYRNPREDALILVKNLGSPSATPREGCSSATGDAPGDSVVRKA